MKSLFRYIAPPSTCGYLPDRDWSLEYEHVDSLTPGEYQQRLAGGWRRFGHLLFRPRCRDCRECLSLRVLVDSFRMNRSQRRVRDRNENEFRLEIGEPAVSAAKLDLYDRYHAFQAEFKDWPLHPPKDAVEYSQSFVHNPLPTQEWRYYRQDRLVGVGYVDDLPASLSAIYFFYDPDERSWSPGTWNILCLLADAKARRIPHLYLGYYVAACRSMTYKARFRPFELLHPDGKWQRVEEAPSE
jgi:arginine-tRNA-protein transferase